MSAWPVSYSHASSGGHEAMIAVRAQPREPPLLPRPPRLAVLLVALALVVAGWPATAQTLIRDAEIESTLDRIANPILRAAALNPESVGIYIVRDREMNAFVAGGNNIFLNTGMLRRLETVDQLRAVIAHEVGHIAGGHLVRRDAALKGARGVAVIGMLGAAAAALGGSPEAAVGIAAGSQSVAARGALAHSRGEEASADQAGLRFAAAAGSDPAALLEVLRLFRGQDALRLSRMDPYLRTHPLWSERIALIEERAATLPRGDGPTPEDVYWHARMVAKLDGFLDDPRRTLRRTPSDGSETATLARAVANHELPDTAASLALVDDLIARRPDDAFYHELKGQFLLESGRAGPAVASYRRAVQLAPFEPLILGGLGRALLNTDDPALLGEAREKLALSARIDGADPGVLRDLALAEARSGNEGAAALATAERHALTGDFRDAERSAARAVDLLPAGSPGWRRAQDVISLSRRAQK